MRSKIAKKLQKILKKRYQETGALYLADWDKKRIGFEESILTSLYFSNPEEYQNILDEAVEGTDYFLENINSCEVHVCKC